MMKRHLNFYVAALLLTFQGSPLPAQHIRVPSSRIADNALLFSHSVKDQARVQLSGIKSSTGTDLNIFIEALESLEFPNNFDRGDQDAVNRFIDDWARFRLLDPRIRTLAIASTIAHLGTADGHSPFLASALCVGGTKPPPGQAPFRVAAAIGLLSCPQPPGSLPAITALAGPYRSSTDGGIYVVIIKNLGKCRILVDGEVILSGLFTLKDRDRLIASKEADLQSGRLDANLSTLVWRGRMDAILSTLVSSLCQTLADNARNAGRVKTQPEADTKPVQPRQPKRNADFSFVTAAISAGTGLLCISLVVALGFWITWSFLLSTRGPAEGRMKTSRASYSSRRTRADDYLDD